MGAEPASVGRVRPACPGHRGAASSPRPPAPRDPALPSPRRKSKAKPNGKKPAAEEKKVYLEPEYTKSRITDFGFKELVVLPREIDLNEWLASNSAHGRRAGGQAGGRAGGPGRREAEAQGGRPCRARGVPHTRGVQGVPGGGTQCPAEPVGGEPGREACSAGVTGRPWPVGGGWTHTHMLNDARAHTHSQTHSLAHTHTPSLAPTLIGTPRHTH